MVDIRAQVSKRAGLIDGEAEMRNRARAAFKVSIQRIIDAKRPLAALSELGDIEMMEAATELTRKR